MILVDSSAWIDMLRGSNSAAADRLSYELAGKTKLFVPGLVYTEVLAGVDNDADLTRTIRVFAPHLEGPPLTRRDYEEAARIYRTCRSKGVTIRSTIDCLIAALAINNDLPLLTKDADFRLIAKHTKLRLV